MIDPALGRAAFAWTQRFADWIAEPATVCDAEIGFVRIGRGLRSRSIISTTDFFKLVPQFSQNCLSVEWSFPVSEQNRDIVDRSFNAIKVKGMLE